MGTLSNETFDKILWNEELPRMYAATHDVDLESAKTCVCSVLQSIIHTLYRFTAKK